MIDFIALMLLASPVIFVVAVIGLAAMWFWEKTDSMVNNDYNRKD